jgi:methyl-accepting chemotaxis protein
MAQAETSNRRRNYFIKKKFQTNFLIRFVALLLLEAVLIAGLFMFVSQGTLTAAYNGSELTIQQTGVYFFLRFLLITSIAGVGIAAAGVFVFIYLTHRLGGPMYRFEKSIDEARTGNLLQHVQLRKTDEFIEVRDKLSDLLTDLDARIADIRTGTNKASDIAGRAGMGTSKDVEELRQTLDAVKASLRHFKTSK